MQAGIEAVSLRGGDEGEEALGDKMVTWVCPGPLRTYVKEQAHSRSTPAKAVKERDIYIGALELDRALEELLKDEKARLRAFATERGLNLRSDFAQVVVLLVKAGLDAAEAKPPKKGGK